MVIVSNLGAAALRLLASGVAAATSGAGSAAWQQADRDEAERVQDRVFWTAQQFARGERFCGHRVFLLVAFLQLMETDIIDFGANAGIKKINSTPAVLA